MGCAANTAGTGLSVALGGTPVPLPSAQVFSADITPNTGDTVFTVATVGRYRISYHVNTTAALLMGSRLVINGVNNTASTIAPVLSVPNYENEIEVNLAANSTISLQLYPLVLARWFFQRERISQAAYWYSLALTCARDDSCGGFLKNDFVHSPHKVLEI